MINHKYARGRKFRIIVIQNQWGGVLFLLGSHGHLFVETGRHEWMRGKTGHSGSELRSSESWEKTRNVRVSVQGSKRDLVAYLSQKKTPCNMLSTSFITVSTPSNTTVSLAAKMELHTVQEAAVTQFAYTSSTWNPEHYNPETYSTKDTQQEIEWL